MHRFGFPPLFLGVLILLSLPLFAEPFDYDVVVIGGTPGGVAAAVTAARYGHTVALVEYHNHLGAMSASGLGKSDITTRPAIAGFFKEFVDRVLAHYTQTYGPNSKQVEFCRDGYYYEPSVAERIFDEMVAEQKGIRVLKLHRLDEVSRKGTAVVGCRVVNRTTGESIELRGRVFVDATYEGDLAAYAGADYRLGRESRAEFDEPHAGVIYMDHTTRSLLPGTTGLGDDRLVAYTYRLCLTTDPDNQVKPTKPANYDRTRYLNYLKDLELGRLKSALLAFSIAPIPNEKTDVNMKPWPLGFPFAEENTGYPEADWEERELISQHLREITEGLFYFLQNDPDVPEKDRAEANRYGYAKDEFTDNGNFPWQLYVREARRVVGEYTLTENDMVLAPESGRSPIFEDAVSCGEFPIDSFPTRKYEPGHEEALEGYILMLNRFTSPYQIPYRALIPKRVDNLIVPVAVSSTHIAFSSVRMEPAWMALGQAAGTAAHLAIKTDSRPRDIEVERLQVLLLEGGQVLAFFKDIPDCGEAHHAVQFLATKGFFEDYLARPNDLLHRETAREWIEKAADLFGKGAGAETELAPGDPSPTWGELIGALSRAVPSIPFPSEGIDPSARPTRGEFCQFVFEAWSSVES